MYCSDLKYFKDIGHRQYKIQDYWPNKKVGVSTEIFNDNVSVFLNSLPVLSDALNKCISWLNLGGFIYIQVPSYAWLTTRIINVYYKITGNRFVASLSLMHPPFHLYEFSLRPFAYNGIINNYQLIQNEHAVCNTYLPAAFNWLLKPLTEKTYAGMKLYLWV